MEPTWATCHSCHSKHSPRGMQGLKTAGYEGQIKQYLKNVISVQSFPFTLNSMTIIDDPRLFVLFPSHKKRIRNLQLFIGKVVIEIFAVRFGGIK